MTMVHGSRINSGHGGAGASLKWEKLGYFPVRIRKVYLEEVLKLEKAGNRRALEDCVDEGLQYLFDPNRRAALDVEYREGKLRELAELFAGLLRQAEEREALANRRR
jgi:hypothetical protein